jgi:hypothetical protein
MASERMARRRKPVRSRRAALAADDLLPRERWLWWEQLWSDVVALGDRYRLRLCGGWWEHPIAVEALAALAAWIDRYDTGEWDDPPGKLGLLYDLERVRELLAEMSRFSLTAIASHLHAF